jgi:alkanesulfonate monooxygenase SsuD/methylene tetrahydromethanopterin reductase-like flavin-dependent oxidoreductase (luciferase family)
MRRTLITVRALLEGQRLPDPAPGARPLRMGTKPEVPVPLALAALSPGSIRLAGELADRWGPFLWARSRLEEGRALLAEGEARAEAPVPTGVAAGVPVALGRDEEHARGLAAWWISTYATRMGPIYPKMLADRFGMAEGLEAVVQAASGEGPPQLPPQSEALAREVTMLGTYEDAAEAISPWFAAGADSVGLVLPPGRPEEELAEIVQVAARVADRAPA